MFAEYISKYSNEIRKCFFELVDLVKENAKNLKECMWAGMPSFYVGDNFVRIIPFKDHINIEAKALNQYQDQLQEYKFTPKNMLQIFLGQALPTKILAEVFSKSLNTIK